jgi:DNA-binding CsgD family transcriptional regulator
MTMLDNERTPFMESALARLPWFFTERERLVYYWRVMRPQPLTLQQIGNKLGLSRERVRQLEMLAKRRLTRFAPKRRLPHTLEAAIAQDIFNLYQAQKTSVTRLDSRARRVRACARALQLGRGPVGRQKKRGEDTVAWLLLQGLDTIKFV